MSLKAKGLLSLMLSLPDDWNYSISGLVKLSKDGKDSVMSALAELEKFGYLNRVQMINEKGQFSGVEYNIYEQPQEGSTVSAKQTAEKENTVKQTAEKPPQLNTNQLITKNNELYNILNTYGLVGELRSLYENYIEMREENGTALTAKGLERLIERCERLSKNNVRKQKLLLEAAIINNWKNVYHPKDNSVDEEIRSDLKNFYGID
jgi:hypothetical protein